MEKCDICKSELEKNESMYKMNLSMHSPDGQCVRAEFIKIICRTCFNDLKKS